MDRMTEFQLVDSTPPDGGVEFTDGIRVPFALFDVDIHLIKKTSL